MRYLRLLLPFVFCSLLLAQTGQPATPDHFSVPAHSFQDYPFSVADGMRDVRLSGTFQVTGGIANRVRFFVLTDDQFKQWQQAKLEGSVYATGSVDQAEIDVSLSDAPANYHLLFDNPYPYAKSIATTLQWTWTNARK